MEPCKDSKSLVLMAQVSIKRCWQQYRANPLTALVQVFGVQLLPLEAPKIVGRLVFQMGQNRGPEWLPRVTAFWRSPYVGFPRSPRSHWGQYVLAAYSRAAHLPGPTKSSCGWATKHEPCTSEGKVELQERFVGCWGQSLPAGMGQSRCGVTRSSHAAWPGSGAFSIFLTKQREPA